ncbi:MAG TPA: ABC transporter ATP-binding protein [Candidatus Sulfomarinibacteraceae bacterium]|nr:ABC transporter ATP-binding protein [Candidatus Sulfomarinibacteraceae bacterium]
MNGAFANREVLAKIRNLEVNYQTRLGRLNAASNVSLDIYRGEILGLVGESGCGKSTLGKALLRMLPPSAEVSGEIVFDGEDILKYNQKQLRDFRGRRASMIFQDPMTSLNPIQRIREHLLEAIEVHEPQTKFDEAVARIGKLVERLGIQKERLPDYPHQLSGGMRQRVMISLGLVLNAELVIADEATTSLDVIVEAKLLDQLREIRDEFGVTIILITHNIALVAELADRVAVMYAGRIAELGSVYDVFDNPLHPYTKGLLKSVPNIKLDEQEDLYRMAGEPPNLTHPPAGCRFHPRCPEAMPICSGIEPTLLEVHPGHFVHCWLYEDHPQKEAPTIQVQAHQHE